MLRSTIINETTSQKRLSADTDNQISDIRISYFYFDFEKQSLSNMVFAPVNPRLHRFLTRENSERGSSLIERYSVMVFGHRGLNVEHTNINS
jgi:hypothetical protein